MQSDNTSAVLFWAFALMTGGSALCVVATRNVVRMAVALLFTLLGVGGLYFLLAAEFLAAVQLVVYAGGTLILIIFGVMLTSKSPFTRYEPKLPEVLIAVSMAVVLLTALLMAVPTGVAQSKLSAGHAPQFIREGPLPDTLKDNLQYDPAAETLTARGRISDAERGDLIRRGEIALADVPDPAALAGYRASIEKIAADSRRLFPSRPLDTGGGYPVAILGTRLLGDYLLPFEIASVLLLVVMIGAAYLAKARRRAAEDAEAAVATEGRRL